MAAEVSAQYADLPVHKDLLKGSVKSLASATLRPDGRWGIMEEERWSAFLDWLSLEGLLTEKVQSRTNTEGTTSLDDLRAGDGGAAIPRKQVPASALFTNEFLPGN